MDSPGVVFDSMCSYDLRAGATQDCIGENASICMVVAFLFRISYKLVVFGMRNLFLIRITPVDVHNQKISTKCSISDGKSRFCLCFNSSGSSLS